MAALVRFGNWLAVMGIALVLLVAFALQFVQHELPCPLCLLQRIAFVLCGFGFLLNLRFGAQPAHYGAAILGASFGLAVSGRQALLHILPGDTGYGPPLLGLHLYSWNVVFFAATILGVAVLMLLGTRAEFERQESRRAPAMGRLARLAAWLLALVTLANAVGAFVLCGPIECPDNPTSYWLFTR
jgi:disulfide bond formation protein DsbB